MACAHARLLIGKTTNRASTSCRNDSRLMLSRMRPFFTSMANSKRVMSQIAKPPSFLRAPSIAALAFCEIWSWSNASQTTT